ncbi:SH3 and PX domain-containing protein 2B-like isoform X2 [Littorina saxatilis]|uniref:SH3 and PX domain-containing protein 2B-like isoform X2 n=1 Tax=Littorina saxatilis TaxID=31220 RepID=UPI0038B667BA
MTKTIVDIQVVDAEKRRVPSKHYVYVIVVKWSDNSSMVVYRRYSRFFDLQTQLLDKFPIEAGSVDPTLRLIPFLPGKIFFGRSQVRDVAMKRLSEIDAYCKSVLALPHHISQCDEVLAFFEVEPEDLDPPKEEPKNKGEKKVDKISGPKSLDQYVAVADYIEQEKGEMTLTAGMIVEVTEKSESGWWFVNAEEQQGWVPSTYLEPVDGTAANQASFVRDGQEEKFICIETFTAQNDDEISLEKGVIVEVEEKSMDGWWKVKYQGREGYAPATYLKKSNDPYAKSLVEKSRQSGVKIIGNLSDVSNLLASSTSPRNSGIFSGDFAAGGDNRASSASMASRDDDEYDEWDDEENDVLKKLDSRAEPKPDSLAKVLLKQRSLERGGSLKPPPRQNSIQKMVVLPTTPPVRSSTYMTVCDFEDTVGDGISFSIGETVTVLEKSSSGWWFVKREQDQGWVPESYLEETSASGPQVTHLNSAGQGVNTVEEESDECEDSDDDLPTQPPSAALTNALNSRLKGVNENKTSVRPGVPGPPKLPTKAIGKPPALPSKPKEQPTEETDAQQAKEPLAGLAGALMAKFESKPPSLVNKPGDKPTPPGLPNKPGDKPTPPGLPNKPGGKPTPPGLPVKPADKPGPAGLPSQPGGKITPNKSAEKTRPPWLANKVSEKPGLPNKLADRPGPPGLPSKPGEKPGFHGVPKKPEERDVSGSVSNRASVLRSMFESQQEEKPVKPSFHHPKPTPPAKSFGGSGDSQSKPGLPGKPTFGVKPTAGQKPSIPFKSDSRPASAVKPQFPPPKVLSGPPKLSSKPTFGPKPSADSNNNRSDGTDKPTPNRVQSMAASLGNMGFGQNSSSGGTRPSLPDKKPTTPQAPSQKPSTHSSESGPGKPRVGNFVSELGNKLNFGGNTPGGGGGSVRSPEPSPVSKAAPWSAQTAHSEIPKPPEPSPVTKAAPWSVKANVQQPSIPKAAAESSGVEFEVTADFRAEGAEELAITLGDMVEVLDRQQEDWWLVRLRGEEGWVPSSFLAPAAEWDD